MAQLALTAASVGATLAQGKARNDVANIQAGQLEKQAISDQATAVQDAKQERHKAALLKSRVKALTAAGGSAVSSVDVQNVLSDIDEKGEYNALAALYSGQTAASSKRFQARVSRAEGKNARKQSYFKAGTTILGTASNMGAFGK